MKKSNQTTLLIIAGIGILILAMSTKSFASILKSFLPSVEGFSAKPLWDFKQWSWGYGSPAGYDINKKPAGTITREKAWIDALKIVEAHYKYLKPFIKRDLNANQWAALLSFSYNLGPGNADNLAANINSGNDAALFTQWRKYVIAGGKVNDGLKNRREKEIALWKS